MSQIERNKKVINSFVKLKHCEDNHNYQTKSKTKRRLHMPIRN